MKHAKTFHKINAQNWQEYHQSFSKGCGHIQYLIPIGIDFIYMNAFTPRSMTLYLMYSVHETHEPQTRVVTAISWRVAAKSYIPRQVLTENSDVNRYLISTHKNFILLLTNMCHWWISEINTRQQFQVKLYDEQNYWPRLYHPPAAPRCGWRLSHLQIRCGPSASPGEG